MCAVLGRPQIVLQHIASDRRMPQGKRHSNRHSFILHGCAAPLKNMHSRSERRQYHAIHNRCQSHGLELADVCRSSSAELTRYARRYYAHILCTSAIHSPQVAVLTRYQNPLACIACAPPATRMAAARLHLQTDAATEHSAGTFRCTQRKRAAAP